MNKVQRDILRQMVTGEGCEFSEAEMIQRIARRDQKSITYLVTEGYVEEILKSRYHAIHRTMKQHLYYRVTPKGRHVFYPWYKRGWEATKGDMRTIWVSVLTSAITFILLHFLKKFLINDVSRSFFI